MRKLNKGMMITGTFAIALMACSMVSCSETATSSIVGTADYVTAEVAGQAAAQQSESTDTVSSTAAQQISTEAVTAVDVSVYTTETATQAAASQSAATAAAVSDTDSAPVTTAAIAAAKTDEELKNEWLAYCDTDEYKRNMAEQAAVQNVFKYIGDASADYKTAGTEMISSDNGNYTFRIGVKSISDSTAPAVYYIATKEYCMAEADWYSCGPDSGEAKVYRAYEDRSGSVQTNFPTGVFCPENGTGLFLEVKKVNTEPITYNCSVIAADDSNGCDTWYFLAYCNGDTLTYENGTKVHKIYNRDGDVIDDQMLSENHTGSVKETTGGLEWTDSDGSYVLFSK